MVEINNIKKIYENGRGLKSLSLTIMEGEIICLIGPNGSGKSTALNIVAGISQSEEGGCFIDGVNTLGIEAKKNIGFLEESPFFYGELSIIDFLNFVWGIKYSGENNKEIFRLLEKFDLLSIKNLMLKELSMGLRKRVAIITAIMNYPKLMIFDEPTNGLDTQSLISFKDELLYAQNNNCSIIISSHVLDFIRNIGNRFIFLKEGIIETNVIYDEKINLDNIYKSLYMDRDASIDRT